MKSSYLGRLLGGRGKDQTTSIDTPVDSTGPREIPRHVAIIMDGNGRWARERGLPHEAGHQAGTENIRRIIETFAAEGIEFLTLYAFSTENWGRPEGEVKALLQLLGDVLTREVKDLHESGIRIKHLGRLEGLSPRLQRQVRDALHLTENNTGMTVSVAFNYGGRLEIVDAVKRIIDEGISPDAIDESTISEHLYTADIPDPDLIIRTAGEMRLSNFLTWQAAYAELYYTDAYWPDFDDREIAMAIAAYGQRERRFGIRPVEAPPSGTLETADATLPIASAKRG